jgi:hypothetical protein
MSKAMPMFPLRAAIIGLLFAWLALLTGCSALRLGYSQAPELAYWWLDGYADFNDAQSPRVRDALAQWFAWHRRTQLPDYAALLARLQAEAPADTTPQGACAWWDEIRARTDVAVDRAIPALTDIVLTFTPQQLAHVEQRHAKLNAEAQADFLQPDAAQRLKAAVQRAIERAELFYGRLDDVQRDRVARSVAASPFDAQRWLDERRQRQQDALALLRRFIADPPQREAAQAAVRAYLLGLGRSPREDYRRHSEQVARFNCGFAAELHNSTTPSQRLAAVQKVRGWEADLRSLAADAR